MSHLQAPRTPRFQGTLSVWLAAACLIALVTGFVAWAADGLPQWKFYITVGAVASLAVLLLSDLVAEFTPRSWQPLGSLLVAVALRSGLPLAVLLVASLVLPDELDHSFLMYCLPMYAATLIAGAHGDVARARQLNPTVGSSAR